jgi:hypothetical protein
MSGKWIARAVVGAVLTAGLSTRAAPETVQATDSELPRYIAQGGTVTYDFDLAVLDTLGLGFYAHGQLDEVSGAPRIAFGIEPSSTLAVEADRGVYAGIVGGVLRTHGAFMLDKPGEAAVIGNLALEVDSRGAFVVQSTLGGANASHTAFELDSVMLDFSAQERSLWLIGELSIARKWAPKLEIPRAAGVVIGTIVIDAYMAPIVTVPKIRAEQAKTIPTSSSLIYTRLLAIPTRLKGLLLLPSARMPATSARQGRSGSTLRTSIPSSYRTHTDSRMIGSSKSE